MFFLYKTRRNNRMALILRLRDLLDRWRLFLAKQMRGCM